MSGKYTIGMAGVSQRQFQKVMYIYSLELQGT